MGRHATSIGPVMRDRYPYRSLIVAVLDRARRDRHRGQLIPADERDALRWWASRGGLTVAAVDPLLSDCSKATADP